jgi:integrase
MRLYPRRKANGDRVWWATWTEDKRTVRRSTGCSTKSAAEIVLARWERERADPVYAAANDATFGEEARRFLMACNGAVERGKMAPETLGMYRQKAGALVRLIGADARLGTFDGSTFQQYIDARRADFAESTGKTITESTLYKEWITFRGILKQAWRAQRFGRDPAALKPSHFGPEYKPRETALTWPQTVALLDALPELRARPVAFALGTGARRREVFAAQAGDVDTSAWTVRLRGTKTDAADATIPIPRLMRHLAESGSPPFARWPNARRDLAITCAAIGIPRVTWNDLRRTFASLLVQAGVAPHLVAKLLRHKTTAMIDRVYGRQTAESLAGLIDAQIREPSVNHPKPDKASRGSTT